MRYTDVDTISFTDSLGNTFAVKDIRDIPSETIGMVLDIRNGERIDEIVSRDIVYGKGGEIQAYRIFEANIVKIIDNLFTIDNLKKLNIPL